MFFQVYKSIAFFLLRRIEELGCQDRCSSASTGTASTNASISTRSPPLYYGATPLAAGDDRLANHNRDAVPHQKDDDDDDDDDNNNNNKLQPLLSLELESELQHDVNNGPAYHSIRLTPLIETPPSSVGRLSLEPTQFIAVITFTTTGDGTIQHKTAITRKRHRAPSLQSVA
ncbi:ndt80 like dna-binding family protein [Colletotrichum tabaci]|uniref:Ndt80 like dna-binding family protein n=1 Tax=Colletotrichum tabaci TaxID=1209068 RepID=A0AAV9TPJ0_9PEZI